jgi:hypothetical protein
MGFNLAFKGLRVTDATLLVPYTSSHRVQDKFAFALSPVSVVGLVTQTSL